MLIATEDAASRMSMPTEILANTDQSMCTSTCQASAIISTEATIQTMTVFFIAELLHTRRTHSSRPDGGPDGSLHDVRVCIQILRWRGRKFLINQSPVLHSAPVMFNSTSAGSSSC